MKLEQQVVSLELAKKLKEIGVKQISIFCWGPTNFDDMKVYPYSDDCRVKEWVGVAVSAFTVAELGEMLPHYLLVEEMSLSLEIIKSSVWRFYYGSSLPKGIKFTAGNDDTEADARAKMLIYLIENNILPINKDIR